MAATLTLEPLYGLGKEVVSERVEALRVPARSQPPAVDPAVGTARTMNRCGAAPTW